MKKRRNYLFSIHHVPDLCPWFLQAQLKQCRKGYPRNVNVGAEVGVKTTLGNGLRRPKKRLGEQMKGLYGPHGGRTNGYNTFQRYFLHAKQV
jgi:hypothetical protein